MKCLICKQETKKGYKVSPITNKPVKGIYCDSCYERAAAHRIIDEADWKEYDTKNVSIGYQNLDAIRETIWRDDNIHWWYRQNMVLFVKKSQYEYVKKKFNYSEKKFNTYIHPELYLKNSIKLDRILNGKESLFYYLKLIFKKITRYHISSSDR